MNAQTKVQAATLASAMASAFGAIDKALKSAKNPHFKSKYADLTAVIETIKPALVDNDLFFTQQPEPAQGGVQITTVLHHAGGESLCLGTLFVPANKNDPQGYGSALTYARRYALVTAFGVPTEDDDGNAAVKAVQGQSQRGAVSPEPSNGGPPKTHLDQAEKRMTREIESCGDVGMLDDYLKTPEAKADYKMLDTWRPEAIHGPAPEGLDGYYPIADRIKAKRDAFAIAALATA